MNECQRPRCAGNFHGGSGPFCKVCGLRKRGTERVKSSPPLPPPPPARTAPLRWWEGVVLFLVSVGAVTLFFPWYVYKRLCGDNN